MAAFCHVCQRQVEMLVDYAYAYPVRGLLTPNWRERLECPTCGLNNRMRALVHLRNEILEAPPTGLVYLTEQNTPLAATLAQEIPALVVSNFLGANVAAGSIDSVGVRHEDLTRLSFTNQQLAQILCFDVLEHVPDFRAALRELHRTLMDGGSVLISVPFLLDRQRTKVRARLGENGVVEHLEAPEYHGDPLSTEGCLAFYHFGWDLLDELRTAGFTEVALLRWHSFDFGYLGSNSVAIVARRIATGSRPQRRGR